MTTVPLENSRVINPDCLCTPRPSSPQYDILNIILYTARSASQPFRLRVGLFFSAKATFGVCIVLSRKDCAAAFFLNCRTWWVNRYNPVGYPILANLFWGEALKRTADDVALMWKHLDKSIKTYTPRDSGANNSRPKIASCCGVASGAKARRRSDGESKSSSWSMSGLERATAVLRGG